MIDLPPKIWQPKVKSKFKPDPAPLPDIDEGVFIFEKLGQCVFKQHEKWKNSERTDLIFFNPEKDTEELMANFKYGDKDNNLGDDTKSRILDIIKKYWDSFCSEGARRPILGYEYAINTGSHTPVCKFYNFCSSFTSTFSRHNHKIFNRTNQI